MLGPTNTGKTHACIERMLTHDSGMIGLPLRLLAREVYDRVSTIVGEQRVALVTGEEKRVPKRPDYWICTVEAMPVEREVEFLAVDEIQLIAHSTRGHVFTDRLLNARGTTETWFLGSDTARPLLKQLAPTSAFKGRPRLSQLTHTGQSSLGKLPPRSAVVAFSIPQVYELAERIRARRGGAAVVLGALSPRTRNAQVAMYQAGEVDYLVATDAIGMGLNMAVDHVAFAALRKFDGGKMRQLTAAELAQIAGRAGRHLSDGTFGTLAPVPKLPDPLARSIESHHFETERRAIWRNCDLSFASLQELLDSLSLSPPRPQLASVQHADDSAALKALASRAEVRDLARSTDAVRLLWRTCQIPDYRKLLSELHAELVFSVYEQLMRGSGRLNEDWLRERIERQHDTSGDIDTLMARIAFVRTWTFVSHQKQWLADPEHWQARTRSIEDDLSDALHQRLMQRFVESRRGRGAARRGGGQIARPAEPPAEVLDGPFAKLAELQLKLSQPQLSAESNDWLETLLAAETREIELTRQGELLFQSQTVAQLRRGRDLLTPELVLSEEATGAGDRQRIRRRLTAHLRDLADILLGAIRLRDDDSPAVRGLSYQLRQGLGCASAKQAREQIDGLSEQERDRLEQAGVVFGQQVVFLKTALKSKSQQIRAGFCAAFFGSDAALTTSQHVSVPISPTAQRSAYLPQGYYPAGPRAIRCDTLEKALRLTKSQRVTTPELCNLLGCPKSELGAVSTALGLRKRPRRRARVKRATDGAKRQGTERDEPSDRHG